MSKEWDLPRFQKSEIEELLAKSEEEKRQQIESNKETKEQEWVDDKIKEKQVEEKKLKSSEKRKMFKQRSISYDDMNEKSRIDINITDYITIREGNSKSKVSTKYLIVSHVHNIPLLENNSKYSVWRKFSDIEWFHNFILSLEEFKKLNVPQLPEKSLFTRNDRAYIEKTKNNLIIYLNNFANCGDGKPMN